MTLFRLKIQYDADLAQHGDDYIEVEFVDASTANIARDLALGSGDKLLKIREAKENEFFAYMAGARAGQKGVERFNQAATVAVEDRIANSWKAALPMYLGRQKQQFLDALQKALTEMEDITLD